jgi:hypothetical protein
MKIRLAFAAAGLLALGACNQPANSTNSVDDTVVNITDVTNVEEPEAPVANATNVAAPAVASNLSVDAQTQEDAVASGMTSRVDRANQTDSDQ